MGTIQQQGVFYQSACRIWVNVIPSGQWSHASVCSFLSLNVLFATIKCVFFLFSRERVISLQATLVRATYVAKSGKPDHLSTTDWVKISCK